MYVVCTYSKWQLGAAEQVRQTQVVVEGGRLALIGLVSCVLPLGQVVLISGQQLP